MLRTRPVAAKSKACRMPPYQPARPAGLPRKCTSIISRDLLLELPIASPCRTSQLDQPRRKCTSIISRDLLLELPIASPCRTSQLDQPRRKCTSIISRDLLLEVGQVGPSYLQARDGQRRRMRGIWLPRKCTSIACRDLLLEMGSRPRSFSGWVAMPHFPASDRLLQKVSAL